MDNTIKYVKLEDIIPSKLEPHQEKDNDLEGLITSIQNYGIITPLLLKKSNDKYEIVLGNRRYKAAINLQLPQLPAIILDLNDKQALEYIALDNIQRKNLTPKETEKIYQNLYNKYKIDKTYIKKNLGITPKENNYQEQTFNPEQKFDTITNNLRNSHISQNQDIINIKELNKKNLEREDIIMNNEPINNNIVNTNFNNTQGVNANFNNTQGVNQTTQEPTFGGRFFPSLEDEQTNMNLNNTLTPPEQLKPLQENANPSPLIDLTNLTDANTQQMNTPNPQLEPIPNFSNPTLDNLNQNNINTPSVEPAPFELPNNNSNPQTSNNPLPNLTQEQPNQEMPTLDLINNNEPLQELNIPNISEFNNQINNTPMPNNIPTQNNQQIQNDIPMPNNIAQSQEPTLNEMPNLNTISPKDITLPNQNEPTSKIEKDITPAINTIKSLAETISSLGYQINIEENEEATSHNIIIQIQK